MRYVYAPWGQNRAEVGDVCNEFWEVACGVVGALNECWGEEVGEVGGCGFWGAGKEAVEGEGVGLWC